MIAWATDNYPGRYPKTWTFEGSNDGSSWTTLDTQTNFTAFTHNAPENFSFANTTAYSYYRINISANQGDTYTGITRMWLYGEVIVSGGSSDPITPTLIQVARANGTNTITAMSSGQRIVIGIVSYGGTVTGVACTNVTFTQIGTDLSFNGNKTSVWVGVATGTSGTSITFTGTGTILNIAVVVDDVLTPTLGTQFSATQAGGYIDLSVRDGTPPAGEFTVIVGMVDNTSVLVYPDFNGPFTMVPTSVSIQATCMAVGYAPDGDLVAAARSSGGSSGAVYCVTIT